MTSPSKPQTGKRLAPASKKGNATTRGGGGDNDSFASEDSLPLLISDEDVPDGGGSSSTRWELEDVRAEVDAEIEAEEAGMKNKGKRKRVEPRTLNDRGFLVGDANPKKLQRFSNKITMKNISPGMKLWGVISKFNKKDIVVSLPGGLRGLVPETEAIDHLPIYGDINGSFHVGQLVSCIVLKVDDGEEGPVERRICLSLRLSLLHKEFSIGVVQEGMVLSGYVISIEDLGYVLHFGLNSFSGFMPSYNQTEVKVGQLIQGVVEKIHIPQKLLYMTNDPDVVSKSVTKDLKGMSIDHLIPGMLVDAVVRSSIENGVMLSFLTNFTGSADIFNLHETFPTSKWKDSYPPNKKVNARILFIDPSTKAIGLTMNAHLVQNRPPPTLVQAGEKFDQSKVVRIDKGYGLLLEIPSSPTPAPAYVCISDVAGKKVKKLEETFKEGSHVRVKVLGFRHFEGLATGTLKELGLERVQLWKESRILDFDGSILLRNREIARMSKGMQRAEYIKWVNKVLKFHNKGQELDEFSLRFGLLYKTEKSIDYWLKCAFDKKVQRLELDFSFRDNSVTDEFIQNVTYCGIPTFGKASYGFPRLLDQNTEEITDLHWRSQADRYTLALTDFNFLRSLRLSGVAVTGDVLEFILRKFPFLEHLKVCTAPNLFGIRISGLSLALKHLEITHCQEVTSIVVRDTSIVSLKLGCFHWMGVKVLEVENNPKLVDLCVYGPLDRYSPLFFSCQTTLEHLTICFRTYHHNMDGASLSRIPQLTKVRQLILVVEEVENHGFIHLPSMIGSFPNLEKFVLKLKHIPSDFEIREWGKPSSLDLPNLEYFELDGYCGQLAEDAVVMHVAENAASLQRITIRVSNLDGIRFPHKLFGTCCPDPIVDDPRFPHDLFGGCKEKVELLKDIQESAKNRASKLKEKLPSSVQVAIH